jgi:hypothetical protein
MTRRKKVMVNILNLGTIHSGLESMLIEWMSEYRKKYEFNLFLPSARPIPNNRNKICKKFMEGDWDILFMFDEDNIPIRNPFSILDHDLDVCGGVYPGRSSRGYNFHAFYLDENKYPEEIFFKFAPPNKREGLQIVDAVATGCIAIKRDVITKMYKHGLAPFEELFDKYGIMRTSDDMAFCLKCRDLGIKVHADWNIICDHMKETSLLQCIELIQRAAKSGIAEINVGDEKELQQGGL